ncbi:MAG: CPBP family intramembrane metalloprotease [Bacteroidetes bacterium]|nr:CPBP family intramembrane metalloprotease [Bacteroidota bacterium]
MNENISILKPIWDNLFRSTWLFGLLLIFVWGIPRFIIVLSANVSGNYNLVSVIFITMWISPWIFLSKFGRSKIGLKRAEYPKWIVYGFFLGILFCSFMFLIINELYGDSIGNWFLYISNSYSNIPENITHSDKLIYFIIYAFISMIFSPIGEELFYRGIIHECFASKWNDKIATIIDSSAFALTHLAHFGIIYHLGQWSFLLFPSILWVIFIFFIGVLFYVIRKKSGSILGSIVCHAGFNLAMMYFIFYHIL